MVYAVLDERLVPFTTSVAGPKNSSRVGFGLEIPGASAAAWAFASRLATQVCGKADSHERAKSFFAWSLFYLESSAPGDTARRVSLIRKPQLMSDVSFQRR